MTRDRPFDAARVYLADALSGGVYWTRRSAAVWDRYLRSKELSVLDEAIVAYRRAAAVTPPAHPDRGCRLSKLGYALRIRFDRVGELWCLDAAVNIYRQAANATPEGHAHRQQHLSQLVTILRRRLEETGDTAALDDIVAALQQLADACPDNLDRARRLCELGELHWERFRQTDELSSLTAAAEAYRVATEPPLHRHAHQVANLDHRAEVLAALVGRVAEPQLLNEMVHVRRQLLDDTPHTVLKYRDRLVDLSSALWVRYRHDARPARLEELLEVFQLAAASTPHDHPERGCRLSDVAGMLGKKLGESADPALLAEIINLHRQAVDATPASHPHRLQHLARLGTALHRRYQQFEDVAVLEEVIDVCRQLVGATSPDDPGRLNYLVDLSRLLLDRYQQTRDGGLLEETIAVHRDLTAALPRDDPDRPRHLSNLGKVLLDHFQRSKDPALLDPIIDVFRQAMTVMPVINPQRPKVLSNLGAALAEQAARADPSERQARWPEAVAVLRKAADALPTGDPDWPLVRCNLGAVLQQKFEQLKDPADLREAVDVFRNAVETTPVDNPHWLTCLAKLAGASLARAEQPDGPAELLDEAITTQRRLLDATPTEKPERANHAARLAGALQFRHQRLGDLDALEEAVSIHRALAAAIPPEHPGRRCALHNLGTALRVRDVAADHPAGVAEETIEVLREAAGLPADRTDHPDQTDLDDERWAQHLSDLVEALGTRAERTGELPAVDEMIVTLRRLTRDLASLADQPRHLRNLGSALLFRHERSGGAGYLDEAIKVLRQAVDATPTHHPDRPTCLAQLGEAVHLRYHDSLDVALLNEAIDVLRLALDGATTDTAERCRRLRHLGRALHHRYDRSGDRSLLEESVTLYRQAVALSSTAELERCSWLDDLGDALLRLARHTGQLTTLRNAVEAHRQAVTETPADHPQRAHHLCGLGGALLLLSERSGDPSPLAEALTVLRTAVTIAPLGHPDRIPCLINLGSALRASYAASGVRALLDEAIGIEQQAADRASEATFRAGALASLSHGLSSRYDGNATADVLDEAVRFAQQALAALPADHVDRGDRLSDLGNALQTRYRRTGERYLLDAAILRYQQAVAATPADHAHLAGVYNGLGSALHWKYDRTGELGLLNEAIDWLQQAVEVTPVEHLHRPMCLTNLGVALQARYDRTGDQEDLAKAVKRQQAAVAAAQPHHHDLPVYLTNLGNVLTSRFRLTRDLALLDDSIRVHRDACTACAAEHPMQPCLHANLSSALRARYRQTGELADIDEAVEIQRRAVAVTPTDHPHRSVHLAELGTALLLRHDHPGTDHPDQTDLEPSGEGSSQNSLFQTTLPIMIYLSDESAHEQVEAAVEDLLAAAGGQIEHRDDPVLGSWFRRVWARIGQAGHSPLAREAAILATHAAESRLVHAQDATVTATMLQNLGPVLAALQPTKEAVIRAGALLIVKMDSRPLVVHQLTSAQQLQLDHQPQLAQSPHEILSVLELQPDSNALRACDVAADHPAGVAEETLETALLLRHDNSGDDRDLVEAADVSRQAVAAAPAATPREQIDVHARWGRLAARTGDWTAALDALAAAVELLPRIAPAGLHRDDQEHHLAGFAGIASDAAACALQVGDSHRAVELLELGRGVLLKQAVSRGEEIELRERDVALAERLDWLRAALHRGATTVRSDVAPGPDPATLAPAAGQLSELTAELEQLLRGIRAIPGLERFHLPPAIDDLLTELSDGPVVLINVSQFRSDALVLDTSGVDASDVRVIPLPALDPDIVRDRAAGFLAAIDCIHDYRQPHTERRRARQGIRGTLCWLWEAVAAPVLDTLALTAPADPDTPGPRLWWSPTGLLSLLPLHAAGHHHDGVRDPADPLPRTVIDRVVSSYTPTVQMLHRARRLHMPPVGAPRVLAISMSHAPSADTLSGVLNEAFASADQSEFHMLRDVAANRQRVIDELPAHTWVHFACHSYTDLIRPSASCLVLHDHAKQPLTALDISGLRLRGVQLTFLSACDTARTSVDLADEAIHLASSFQIAGCPHVVGTLWSVNDGPATEVAQSFYRTLPVGVAADGNRIATAVHHATRQLRKSSPNDPWHWGAHIHIGP